VLGDLDDDGVPEWLARSNRLGSEHFHFGQLFLLTAPDVMLDEEEAEESSLESPPYIASSITQDGESGTLAMWPVELPLNASGSMFGYSVAWVGDFDRDGYEDAIASSTHATHAEGEINSGGVWFFAGQADGLFDEGVNLGRFPGFSSWDHVKSVASAGDFNGDGDADFAVILGHDERPQAWSTEYWLDPNSSEDSCQELAYDQGGIYIFLGGQDADLRPDFVFYGDQAGLVPESLTGGFDFNGDGHAD
jgi:hypothetical protein